MVDWALVAAKGDEGPQGPNEIPAGSAAAPGLPIHGDPDTGLWSSAANTIDIATAGVERFYIGASGNVGVNNPNGFGTSAAKCIGIGDGTAPSTSPASMVQLYSENGNLRARDTAGIIKQVSGVEDMYPGGRLGLRAGFPQADIELVTTNAQTLYYQPYMHDRVCIWNGTVWVPFTLVYDTLSLSLAGLTTTLPYDIYIFDNGGTLTLQAVVWTGTTGFTRGIFNGMPVKGSDARFLYLGTIQMAATGQCEDSYSRRFVWNYFNRVPGKLRKFESTASWSNSGTSFRSMNGSTANRIEIVSGDYFSVCDVTAYLSSTVASGTPLRRAGIGIDSTTVSTFDFDHGTNSATGLQGQSTARFQGYFLGYHFFQGLEVTAAACTFQGSSTAGCSAGLYGIWQY